MVPPVVALKIAREDAEVGRHGREGAAAQCHEKQFEEVLLSLLDCPYQKHLRNQDTLMGLETPKMRIQLQAPFYPDN